MNRVAGKVALVKGGASGIGLSAATLLAEEGAAVVIADYNIKGAKDVAAGLRRQGKQVQAVFLDASEADSIQNAVTFTVETYGKLNILFNNVGLKNLQKDLDVVAMDLAEWDCLMNVNVKSVLLGARYAIPHMKQAGGGSIINTASMSAFAGDSIRSAYGTSKAAVVYLASDESKFMTGQTLQIEGGHYIGNPTSPDFLAMQP